MVDVASKLVFAGVAAPARRPARRGLSLRKPQDDRRPPQGPVRQAATGGRRPARRRPGQAPEVLRAGCALLDSPAARAIRGLHDAGGRNPRRVPTPHLPH